MSLIRCLSNAEGLYIYGDGSCYNVSTGRYWSLSNTGPDSGNPAMRIPYEVFEKAAREWLASRGAETVEADGFKIESDAHIFVDTLEPVPSDWGILEILVPNGLRCVEHVRTFWGLKLTYQRPDVDGKTPEELYTYLYRITWCYAIRSFEKPEEAVATSG